MPTIANTFFEINFASREEAKMFSGYDFYAVLRKQCFLFCPRSFPHSLQGMLFFPLITQIFLASPMCSVRCFLNVLGGFEVNFMDDVGQTLLNWASAFGTLEMVSVLFLIKTIVL
jgi:hypothetical protein